MYNLDCLLNIVIQADYKTTLNFLQTSKIFSNDLWKSKCKYLFPDKPYFDFWLGKENYLVQCRNMFCFCYNFATTPENIIYESDPALEIMCNAINNFNRGCPHLLIKFPIKKQFVAIRYYQCRTFSLIGQYSTKNEAIIGIKNCILEYGVDNNLCIIIDLKYAVPVFSKLGKFRKTGIEDGLISWYPDYLLRKILIEV